MIIRRSLFGMMVVAVAAFGATAVVAQNDPIAQRHAAMKAVCGQNAVATQMLTGKEPFSTEAAQKVFKTFADSATRMRKLFPDRFQGGDTKALPAIWEKRDDFEGRLAKFAEQSNLAAAKVTDLESFKQQINSVRPSCGACHTPYRGK